MTTKTPPSTLTVLEPPDERAIPANFPGVPSELEPLAEAARAAIARTRSRDADVVAAQAAVTSAEVSDPLDAAANPDDPPPEKLPAARQALHEAKRRLAGALEAQKVATRELSAAITPLREDWQAAQRERIASRAEKLRALADEYASELEALAVEETVIDALERHDAEGWHLDVRPDRTTERRRTKANENVRDWARTNRSRMIPMDDTELVLAALRWRAGWALGEPGGQYGRASW